MGERVPPGYVRALSKSAAVVLFAPSASVYLRVRVRVYRGLREGSKGAVVAVHAWSSPSSIWWVVFSWRWRTLQEAKSLLPDCATQEIQQRLTTQLMRRERTALRAAKLRKRVNHMGTYSIHKPIKGGALADTGLIPETIHEG